jgi:hypothetical protein
MDVNRIPKKAWFTFRDVLSPVAVSLSAERCSGFAGESLPVELWVSNDHDQTLEHCSLVYEITQEGQVIASGKASAQIPSCSPSAQGAIVVHLPDVPSRTLLKVSASLVDSTGSAIHDSELTLEVFPKFKPSPSKVFVFGDEALGSWIRQGLGMECFSGPLEEAEVILITDSAAYFASPQKVDDAVRKGAMAVLLSLPVGTHMVGSHSIEVRIAGMGPRHFVSCDSGHPLVEGFKHEDFKFWFNETLGHASPILATVLEADGWSPILQSGDGCWGRPWGPVPVSVEKSDGEGSWRICQVELPNRLRSNPAAAIFAQRFLSR